MSRPKGCKQTPEAREKIRQSLIKRWKDPAHRAHNLPLLLAKAAIGRAVSAERRKVIPPEGTRERLQYLKVRSILGPEAARTIL